MSTSTIPIPQGAKIADAPAAAPTSVPIPDNAIIEQQPGKGVTTDSMDADYQFKHPALTDDEMKRLQAANLDRPLYRKLLGLPAADPAAAALNEKDTAHQTESAQQSSYVQDQLTEKAAGGAVVASAPAIAASSVPAVGAAARAIAVVGPPAARAAAAAGTVLSSPTAKWAAKELIKGALIGTGGLTTGGIIAKILHWW